MENNEKNTMTCIICPMGCQLEVTKISEVNGKSEYSVTGNACTRGESYARKELTNPTRTLTCTVAVNGGVRRLVPAKSKTEIPRDMQLECMQVIRRLSVYAPVHEGDILVEDILNTGADIIACDDVEEGNAFS
jgi:CxxC motif-containing protein